MFQIYKLGSVELYDEAEHLNAALYKARELSLRERTSAFIVADMSIPGGGQYIAVLVQGNAFYSESVEIFD